MEKRLRRALVIGAKERNDGLRINVEYLFLMFIFIIMVPDRLMLVLGPGNDLRE